MKIRAISATLFLVILCVVVVSQPHIASAQKTYYLTRAVMEANLALKACASGFHMASPIELSVPGNLRYDITSPHAVNATTSDGCDDCDQGHGPPLRAYGWLHSGYYDSCLGWTSNASTDKAAVAWIDWTTQTSGAMSADVVVFYLPCNTITHVWCISNP